MATGMIIHAMEALLSVVRSRELLWNLTLRELRTKYRKSLLGWSWSMLNPLATVAIYSFVFGVLFQSTAPAGDPSGLEGFAFFLLCALLPWNFFALVTNLGLTSITSNAGLVRRVAFPREVLVFSNVLHACVQFSIELSILVIVLTIFGGPVFPWIFGAIFTALLLTLFAAGFALAFGALAVLFRDITYLWSIALQVWFFMTPVVYPPSLVEERIPSWAETILNMNPLRSFTIAFRNFLYDGRWPTWPIIVHLVVSSLLILAGGWSLFRRLGRRLPEEV